MTDLSIEEVLGRLDAQLANVEKSEQIDLIKSEYLGRRGVVTTMLKGIASLPAEEKKRGGKRINDLREVIETRLRDGLQRLREKQVAATLNETIDVTAPGRKRPMGSIHPVTQMTNRMIDIFSTMGFDVADGDEIETDYYNFTALNHGVDHPARSMHDTFYIQNFPELLLRTHTSPVQIHYMLAHQTAPSIRVIAPGRVYRVDHDSTHSPMFHQLEGLCIDEKTTFADLKGILQLFFQHFFEDQQMQIRFRPSFFPFTEPSAEFDIRWENSWLEAGGCGMVHPNVLRAGGFDPARAQGFAFGLGIDRIAMLYYGVRDIRLLFENDLRFLKQFS